MRLHNHSFLDNIIRVTISKGHEWDYSSSVITLLSRMTPNNVIHYCDKDQPHVYIQTNASKFKSP